MDYSVRRFLLPFFLIFLWKACRIKAYEGGICDEPNPSIYCTCTTRYSETTVVCFINQPISNHDEVWRAMSDVENVISLKLHSMLPVKLEYIPTESLQRMDSLRVLTLQQGNLGTLKSYAVSDLKNLRELQLEGSEITNFEQKAFSNLPNLKKLSLSENLLQEVLADTMVGLEGLEKLFLDRNNISRVEGCAFCELHNLRELELWGNQITDLTDYMFLGLRYLKRLDLYKNQIRILNDKIFHSMPKLVEIDLKDNLITYIAPHAFHGLDKLQRLMLNSNKIKMLPDEVFKSLPNLRSIDLYNNDLETLQVELLEQMANVKDEHFSLAFKENPLKCDCRLTWVRTYHQLNKSHQFTRELHDLECRPDGENQTLQIVHLMKLDCSRATTVNQKSVIAASRSVTQPANLVPYEIHGRKNKKITTVVDEEEPEIQDGEAKEEMEEKNNGEPSSSITLVGDIWLTVCVTLAVFLVRKRKGTL